MGNIDGLQQIATAWHYTPMTDYNDELTLKIRAQMADEKRDETAEKRKRYYKKVVVYESTNKGHGRRHRNYTKPLIYSFNHVYSVGELGFKNESKKTIIYLFRNPASKYVKIGITDNLEARRRKLDCATGLKLEVIATAMPIALDVAKLEVFLHSFHKEDRLLGEWFNLDWWQIKRVIKLFELVHNNPSIFKKHGH